MVVVKFIMIESSHDGLKHRNGLWGRGKGFIVNFYWLDVTLSWWFIWLVIISYIDFFHASPKTGWEKVMIMNNACVILLSNYST